MRLGAVATVGLEGTLGHRTVLIRESLPYGQALSITDPVRIRQRSSIGGLPLVAQRSTISSTSSQRLQRYAQNRQAARLRCRVQQAGRLCVSSSSRAILLRMHRICVVNSSKNLSISMVTSRVFTSSGATQFFADKPRTRCFCLC
jgi:hypothetical protein